MANIETPNDFTAKGTFTKKDITNTQKFLEWSVKSGKKLIILTEALVLLSLFSKFSLIRNVNAINYRIEDLKYEIIDNQSLEDKYIKILNDISKIKEVEARRINWEERITDLNSKIPDGLILEEVINTENTQSIKGSVQTIGDFAFFIQKLFNDEKIVKVILKSSQYEKSENSYIFSMDILMK